MGTTIEEVTARLARLEDERAIERLIWSYGHALDFDTPDAYAALFTEDAIIEIRSGFAELLGVEAEFPEAGAAMLLGRGAARTERGFAFSGHAALRRFVTRERVARGLHVSTQPLVEITGPDTAEASSYLRIYHQAKGADAHLTHFGRYLDRFVRTPAGWRIRHRICEL